MRKRQKEQEELEGKVQDYWVGRLRIKGRESKESKAKHESTNQPNNPLNV